MSNFLSQKRRRAEQALARITRMLADIASVDRALREYQEALASALGKSVEGMEDVHAILLHVCHAYAVTPGAIMSRVRTENLVEPRQMAMALAHVLTPHSFSKLGAFFQRDHGTIIHAVNVHGGRLDTDRAYHRRFDEFVAALSPATGERRSA